MTGCTPTCLQRSRRPDSPSTEHRGWATLLPLALTLSEPGGHGGLNAPGLIALEILARALEGSLHLLLHLFLAPFLFEAHVHRPEVEFAQQRTVVPRCLPALGCADDGAGGRA